MCGRSVERDGPDCLAPAEVQPLRELRLRSPRMVSRFPWHATFPSLSVHGLYAFHAGSAPQKCLAGLVALRLRAGQNQQV